MAGKLISLPVRAFRHLFMDKSYEPYYSADVWERKYRHENYELGDAKEDGRYGSLIRVLSRYDNGPMLDLGCGDGSLWKYCRLLTGSFLAGVDYSETAIAKAIAMTLPDTHFHCGDYRTYQPDRLFSVVLFNESLYYVNDYLGAVSTAGSWLAPDGVIIISMFDTAVTRRIWRQLAIRRKWMQSVHVQDEGSHLGWTIRVFPAGAASGAR